MKNQQLMNALAQYAANSANLGEGCDILSAIVNLVDTIRECPEDFPAHGQAARERAYVDFIVSHDNDNRYQLDAQPAAAEPMTTEEKQTIHAAVENATSALANLSDELGHPLRARPEAPEVNALSELLTVTDLAVKQIKRTYKNRCRPLHTQKTFA